MKKILMVLTSHDRLGNTGRKTGLWLEEFAAPHYAFKGTGVAITAALPRGGQPPIDPKSDEPENQTPSMTRFKVDKDAQSVLANTARLANLDAKDFDTVFYSGGHGPLSDVVEDRKSITLIEDFYGAGKPVAAVCHAPAVFHHVTYQGHPIVKGNRVTGFANSEEEAFQLTKVVPFLVEDDLKALGGHYEKAEDWASFSIIDGRLITGENPAPSTAAAQSLLTLL
jgi:putative intracellular protease/amidase